MGVKKLIAAWGADILSVVFPNTCAVCGTTLVEGEDIMCLTCLANLPRTGLHGSPFSEIHKRLATHSRLERGASWFYYHRHSPYAKLIHQAKYRGLPDTGRRLGRMYAREIMADGFFDGIDIILPVPLHPIKHIARGYNQSREIARGVAEVTAIEIGDNLVAGRSHSTQTRLGSYARWLNARGSVRIHHPDELAGRHVLVIDDVLTTGATLLTCCEAIHDAVAGATVSVLTLGLTRSD